MFQRASKVKAGLNPMAMNMMMAMMMGGKGEGSWG